MSALLRRTALWLGLGACLGAGVILAPAAGATDADLWRSPSGNIRCAYVDQTGIGCYTRHNGRWAVLQSFGDSGVLYARKGLPAGRVLPYGRTWKRSTFRCQSRRDGMRCWSRYTGHGFHISRERAYAW